MYDHSAGDGDCMKACKARESLPDILASIRRAKTHADYLDAQLMRIESAYGEDRPKGEPQDPTPEPPFISMVENEARELADFVLDLQEGLQRRLDLLFGDRV